MIHLGCSGFWDLAFTQALIAEKMLSAFRDRLPFSPGRVPAVWGVVVFTAGWLFAASSVNASIVGVNSTDSGLSLLWDHGISSPGEWDNALDRLSRPSGSGMGGSKPSGDTDANEVYVTEFEHSEQFAFFSAGPSGGSSSVPVSTTGAGSGSGPTLFFWAPVVNLPGASSLELRVYERALYLPSPPGSELLRPPRG